MRHVEIYKRESAPFCNVPNIIFQAKLGNLPTWGNANWEKSCSALSFHERMYSRRNMRWREFFYYTRLHNAIKRLFANMYICIKLFSWILFNNAKIGHMNFLHNCSECWSYLMKFSNSIFVCFFKTNENLIFKFTKHTIFFML